MHHGATVYGGMATVPGRQDALRHAVASLLPQLDHLFVHANYAASDPIPACLVHPKITVVRSSDTEDWGDAGKFYSLCTPGRVPAGAYTVTVDDDIGYPPQFVTTMLACCRRHMDRAIVTYHGGILPPRVTSYTRQRNAVHFNDANARDLPANIMGTGAALYPPGLCQRLPFRRVFTRRNSADLLMALHAQRAGVPVVITRHPANAFRAFEHDNTLWDQEVAGHARNALARQNTKDAGAVRWVVHPAPRPPGP